MSGGVPALGCRRPVVSSRGGRGRKLCAVDEGAHPFV